MVESQLQVATWGLVVATFLLVIATAIPALMTILNRREDKRRVASRLIPTLHMLRSRVESTVKELVKTYDDPQKFDEAQDYLDFTETDLEDLDTLISESREIGLRATNELYVARHLITQARIELLKIIHPSEQTDTGAARRMDNKRRFCRLYKAALSSIDQVETELPGWSREIDGEDFWTRFRRLSSEREDRAEKDIVDMRRRLRDSPDQ